MNRLQPFIEFHRVFDYRESRFTKFFDTLILFPWQRFYLSNQNVDEKCDIFHNCIDEAISKIPVEYVPMTDKDKPWITPFIKSLINKRYHAFRRKQFGQYI